MFLCVISWALDKAENNFYSLITWWNYSLFTIQLRQHFVVQF